MTKATALVFSIVGLTLTAAWITKWIDLRTYLVATAIGVVIALVVGWLVARK